MDHAWQEHEIDGRDNGMDGGVQTAPRPKCVVCAWRPGMSQWLVCNLGEEGGEREA